MAQNNRPNSVEVAETAEPHGPTGVKRPHCVNVAWGWRWLCERLLLRGHPDRLKLLKRRRPETDLLDPVQLIHQFCLGKRMKEGILDSLCLILGASFTRFITGHHRRKTGSGLLGGQIGPSSLWLSLSMFRFVSSTTLRPLCDVK